MEISNELAKALVNAFYTDSKADLCRTVVALESLLMQDNQNKNKELAVLKERLAGEEAIKKYIESQKKEENKDGSSK